MPRMADTRCYTTSQDPHSVRAALSTHVFGVPESKIRVISPDVGGGFGMKADLYADDALVLWAARRCGRPVKWTATRSESLLCDNHARDQLVFADLALDENGKFLAIRSRAYQALGAYWWGAATAPLFWSVMFVPSLYDVQIMQSAPAQCSPIRRRLRSTAAPGDRRRSI